MKILLIDRQGIVRTMIKGPCLVIPAGIVAGKGWEVRIDNEDDKQGRGE